MEQTFLNTSIFPCCLESRCTEKNQARSFMTSTHASVRCSILVFTDIRRYATVPVRFASPSSSHLHFEALLSLLGSSRKPLKTKFTPAVSSVYSLSLSLSLSAWAHSKKKSVPAQHSWSKQKFAKPQFQVYSFFSGFRVQHAEFELRAGRGQRRCHDCRIENEPRGSSAD